MRDLWLTGCTPTRLRTGVRVECGQAYKMVVPAMHLQVSLLVVVQVQGVLRH